MAEHSPEWISPSATELMLWFPYVPSFHFYRYAKCPRLTIFSTKHVRMAKLSAAEDPNRNKLLVFENKIGHLKIINKYVTKNFRRQSSGHLFTFSSLSVDEKRRDYFLIVLN